MFNLDVAPARWQIAHLNLRFTLECSALVQSVERRPHATREHRQYDTRYAVERYYCFIYSITARGPCSMLRSLCIYVRVGCCRLTPSQ